MTRIRDQRPGTMRRVRRGPTPPRGVARPPWADAGAWRSAL